MGNIQQKFSGDSSELEKTIEKMRREYIRLEEQMAKVTRTTKEGANEAKRVFDEQANSFQKHSSMLTDMASGVAKWTASMGPLGVAMAGISREMEHQAQLREKALQQQLSVAQTQSAAAMMLGPTASKADVAKFFESIRGISASTGVSEQTLNLAGGNLLSSTGGDQARTLNALRALAPAFVLQQGDLPQVASFVPALAQAIGNPNDMQGAAGFAATLMSNSRITDVGALRNLIPAISKGNVMQQGASERHEALATASFLAGLSIAASDETGAQSATATNTLNRVLESTIGGQMDSRQRLERLRQIQNEMFPEANGKPGKMSYRDKFLQEFGENEFQPLARDLLDPRSLTSQAVETAFKNISPDAAAWQSMVGNATAATAQQMLATQVAVGDNRDAIQQTIDTPAGARAAMRKEYRERMEKLNLPFGSRFFENQMYDFMGVDYGKERLVDFRNSQPSQAAGINQTLENIEALERLAAALEKNTAATERNSNGGGGIARGNEPD